MLARIQDSAWDTFFLVLGWALLAYLIQAGMIGLLDAMDRYESTHQAQFETYATLRIRGAMLDELRSMDWTPRSVRQAM